MKIVGTLQMALDFAARRDIPHEVITTQTDGKWYVHKRGPKYANTYVVTDYDDEGLAWLKAHLDK